MKIAYITSVYARASDTFIRREVQGLRDMGHEVHTFSARRMPADHNVSEEIVREQANTMYLTEQPIADIAKATVKRVLKSPKRFLNAAKTAFGEGQSGLKNRVTQTAYLAEAALLAEELESRGVEHLHNHLAQSSATVAMLTSKLSGIPYSMTVHGPHIFFEPRNQALGTKVSNSAFTACITHFCESQVKIFTPYKDWDKLAIIHCGLGENFLAQEPTPVPNNFKAVTVGRLCEEKGQMMLIDAVFQLKQRGIDMELVVVGDGPMRGAMEDLAKERGIAHQVDFRGWQGSDEVRDAIQECRIMLHPSFAEGLPVVIMEALALGRPVLTTQIAGVSELVVHGKNGWLTAPGNVDNVVDLLEEAMRKPLEELTEMGLHGRNLVLQNHSNAIETKKLAELLETKGGSTARN